MKKQIYRYVGPLFLLALVGIVIAWAQVKMAPNFRTTGPGSGPNVEVPNKNKTTGRATVQTGTQDVEKLLTAGGNALLAANDYDGDGVPDNLDSDDDNDGIPDAVEDGSSAVQTQQFSSTGVSPITGLTVQGGNPSLVLDGNEGTSLVFTGGQSIMNKTLVQFTFPAPVLLTGMELLTIPSNSGSLLTDGSSVQMQGLSGSTWVDIGTPLVPTLPVSSTTANYNYNYSSIFSSGALVPSIKFPMLSNTTAYTGYRIVGVGGNTGTNSIMYEAYFTGPCTDGCVSLTGQLVPKRNITVSSGLTFNSLTGGSAQPLPSLVDGSDLPNFQYTADQAIGGKAVAEFAFPNPTILSGIEVSVIGPYSFLKAAAMVKMQGWDGSTWIDLGANFAPAAPTSSSYLTFYSVKFPMPGNTSAYNRYRILGVSGTISSAPITNSNNILIPEVYFLGLGIQGSGLYRTDLDNDGLANSLDLDSDGDGCPDAIEGGASFTIAKLVNSSLAGGNSNTPGVVYTGTSTSPVISNLGNTVSSAGIPTVAGSGQSVGTSQNKSIQATNCQALANGAGTLDCSTTQMIGIVAGTPGNGLLRLTINVTTVGMFPVTISGSGLSANPSPFTISATATGVKTFYVPVVYSGAAFAAGTTITVTGAGTCTVDMTAVSPLTVVTSVLNLGPACTPTVAATLSK